MSRKISRKKPKGAPHAAIRDLSEAQKRRVSIIGMTSVIYQSFAGMSYVDAIAEAEKHVDACCASPGPVSGHQMSLADMEAQIDMTAEWLYGLSRKHGPFAIKSEHLEEGLEQARRSLRGIAGYGIPIGQSLSIFACYFRWVLEKKICLLYITDATDPIVNKKGAWARCELCDCLTFAVSQNRGVFPWDLMSKVDANKFAPSESRAGSVS